MAPPNILDQYVSVEEVQSYVHEYGAKSARELILAIYEKTGYAASERTVQKYVVRHQIQLYPRHLTQAAIDNLVRAECVRLGPSAGRRTVWGGLMSSGVAIGQNAVSAALARADPRSHQRREFGIANLLNPARYRAPWPGYNLHIDQNEKLVDFGCVLVAGVDGQSYFCVGFAAMPHKNNLAIYRDFYKPLLESFGLFDSLITDCGREFYLSLFVQSGLAHRRIDSQGNISTRPPYRQLKSTENNRIERLWREVNQRVTLPLKNILHEAVQWGDLDMTDEVTKFAVSSVVQSVATELMGRYVAAHNEHPVQGNGVPSRLFSRNRAYNVTGLVPGVDGAEQWYRDSGGVLSRERTFGVDPCGNSPTLKSDRDSVFEGWLDAVNGIPSIATEVLNGQSTSLMDSIQEFRNLCDVFSV